MTIDLVAFKNALELLFAKEELSVDNLNKIQTIFTEYLQEHIAENDVIDLLLPQIIKLLDKFYNIWHLLQTTRRIGDRTKNISYWGIVYNNQHDQHMSNLLLKQMTQFIYLFRTAITQAPMQFAIGISDNKQLRWKEYKQNEVLASLVPEETSMHFAETLFTNLNIEENTWATAWENLMNYIDISQEQVPNPRSNSPFLGPANSKKRRPYLYGKTGVPTLAWRQNRTSAQRYMYYIKCTKTRRNSKYIFIEELMFFNLGWLFQWFMTEVSQNRPISQNSATLFTSLCTTYGLENYAALTGGDYNYKTDEGQSIEIQAKFNRNTKLLSYTQIIKYLTAIRQTLNNAQHSGKNSKTIIAELQQLFSQKGYPVVEQIYKEALQEIIPTIS